MFDGELFGELRGEASDQRLRKRQNFIHIGGGLNGNENVGKDSSFKTSRTSLSRRPARAASLNFPDCGSISKQIQSGLRKEDARLPET